MTLAPAERSVHPDTGLSRGITRQIGALVDPSVTEGQRGVLLYVAASRLARVPFAAVTIDDIVADSGLPNFYVRGLFADMHEIGTTVLDHERASMRTVQERVSKAGTDPLEQLMLAFRLVGENLASDVVVRAGVRLASESREYFPERRLDPFRTWEAFVTTQLTRARDADLLKKRVDIANTVWTVVAAGMGTKDLIAFHDAWDQAPTRLEAVVRNIVSLIRISADNASDAETRGR